MAYFLEHIPSLLTLTILEIVLGIDNLIFLSIISQKLPAHQQAKARKLGLAFALITRLLLLAFAISLTKLTTPLFTLFGIEFSGRSIFLIAGGIFLLAKATQEIHTAIEEPDLKEHKKFSNFFLVIIQIGILDIVFSLDSILTAIGLTQEFFIMAVAITIAIICMMFASEPLSRFIERNPTIKMLALSFLILIGMLLVADGCGYHIPRGYIYFSLGFSLFVEFLNIISRKRKKRAIKSKAISRN